VHLWLAIVRGLCCLQAALVASPLKGGKVEDTETSGSSSKDTDTSLFNAEYNQRKQNAIQKILGHHLFMDIEKADALAIDEKAELSGHMACFRQKDYMIAMRVCGTYTAGCNLWHLNLWYKAMGDVPVNEGAVASLMTNFFPVPSVVFPLGMTVVADPEPLVMKGRILVVSPIEIIDALIFAVSACIDAQVPDELMNKWVVCMRSVPFTFEKLESEDDRYFKALNIREALMTKAANLVHTATQKIAALMAYVKRKEATSGEQTPKAMAEIFEERAKLSPGAEKFTETYIKAAMYVWDRILKVPELSFILMKIEERWGIASPLNSAYVMESLMQKTKAVDKALWVLHGLYDLLDNKLVLTSELNQKVLTGKNAGGKGLFDLLVYKKEVADYLGGSWAEMCDIEYECKIMLRRISCNHHAFRKEFGSIRDQGTKDL
jgi:hypothetical protein